MRPAGRAVNWPRAASPRRTHMRRMTPATVLIVLIFGTASVLAWQAYESAQSHRRSAVRVLDDYAQFAGWEFARLSQAKLQDAVGDWGHAVAASPASSPLPTPQ